MDLPSPVRVAQSIIASVPIPGRRHRRVWSHRGRAHVEVRGADRVGHGELHRLLERAFASVEGVDWVAWNAALGRAVVSFDGESVDVDDVLDVIGDVEDAIGVAHEPFADDLPALPDDRDTVVRLATELAVDAAALGASVWGSLLRLTPIPIEAASAVSFLEAQTAVREAVAQRIGVPAADAAFAMTNALAQGLAQGPLALVGDMVLRADLLAEQLVRRRVWNERHLSIVAGPSHASAKPCDARDRPSPRPTARADAYAQRSGLATAAAGAALAATGARRVAGGLFVSGQAKAALTGRAAFTAELDRLFARRRVFVLRPEVLRHFELVDVVVVDDESLTRADADHVALIAGRVGLRIVAASGATATDIVRDLQTSGCVVAAVTADDRTLCAADVGVALHDDEKVAWYADVVAQRPELALVLESFIAARVNAERCLSVALAGSGVAAVLTLAGPRDGARAASNAVNVASLIAMGIGTWDARRLANVRGSAGRELPAWHALGITQVLAELDTTENGLEGAQASRRPRNRTEANDEDVVDVVSAELATPLTPVLSAGAGVSAVLGSMVDALLVGGVLVGNVTLGVAQRLRTQRAVRALEVSTDAPVHVLRGQQLVELPYDQLVPGDVITLSRGDVVPADARVLHTRNVLVDESGLTGEPFAVDKRMPADPLGAFVADRHSMLYAGTTIIAGEADAVVVAVGEDTESARALLIGDAQVRASGVERRLAQIARVTVPASLLAGGLLTANSLLRGRPFRQTLSTAVGLVAAVLPEGLPLIATTAQLGAARRLSTRNAIVRAPRTIEALGRVDTLCFDKTGTLTQGAVTLHCVATDRGVERLDELSDRGRTVLELALRATAPDAEQDRGNGSWNGNGHVHVHSADRALIDAATSLGLHEDVWTVTAELPFEHDRAFAAARTVDGDLVRIVVKGAPEVVLPRCVLGEGARREAKARVDELATLGYRVLAIASRQGSARPELDENDVRNLELAGFIGFVDAVRTSARDAVDAIRTAGVHVVMITGDHPLTAEAVARELNVLDAGRVLSGSEIDALDDAALDEIVPDVSVFARVAPSHKARIVSALQRSGRVVAMTGDGTNDAAAIRLADVGVALGERGTPAARHAADVVVTDDKLETIVAAIIEGRAMWGSVRDALSILLGGNLGELGYMLAIGVPTGSSPMNARQTLLVNMLTDLLPAAAIAARPPRNVSPASLLAAGPDTALGSGLTEDIVMRAIATAAGASGAWMFARGTGRRKRANTIGLVALVETQLGQTLVTGGSSPLVIVSTVASVGALAAVVQTPGVSQFFGCTPIGPVGWAIATGAATAGTGTALVLPLVLQAARAWRRSGETRLHDFAEQPAHDDERQLGEEGHK